MLYRSIVAIPIRDRDHFTTLYPPHAPTRAHELNPMQKESAVMNMKCTVLIWISSHSESIDDSDPDKMHCMNNSGSSATYSDYSPSQGSSGSSNPPGNVSSMQSAAKEGPSQTHWTNRLATINKVHACQRSSTEITPVQFSDITAHILY